MAEPEPDWYPDPGKTPGVFRWWTGTEWTDLLASDPDAPPPDEASIQRTVRPNGRVSAGHALRNTLVVGAVLAAVLILFTVLGLQSPSAPRYPEGTPSDLGTPKVQAPKVEFDEKTRQATVRGQITATIPDKPFQQPFVDTYGSDVVGGAVSSDVQVQAETDTTPGWYGVALLGLIAQPLVVEGDLGATAANILQGFADTVYGTAETQVGEMEPIEAPDGFEGYRGHIAYDAKGVEADRDDVVILIAELDNGEVGAWVDIYPTIAADGPREQLVRARETVRLN